MVTPRFAWNRKQCKKNRDDFVEIKVACHNCAGFGKDAAVAEDTLQYYSSLNYDAVALPETHEDHHAYVSRRVVGSAPRTGADTSHTGVAILLSERFASREIGRSNPKDLPTSRICWVRIKGKVCNLLIIAVYFPYKQHLVPLDRVLQHLRDVLDNARPHDCIILIGDYNCQLTRNTPGVTGKWCVATRTCSHGKQVTQLLRRYNLYVASTRFKPKRNASAATWIQNKRAKASSSMGPGNRGISRGRKYLRGPHKGKSKLVEARCRLQLDYIAISHRWLSCISRCRV